MIIRVPGNRTPETELMLRNGGEIFQGKWNVALNYLWAEKDVLHLYDI